MKHFQTFSLMFSLLCTSTFAHAQNEIAQNEIAQNQIAQNKIAPTPVALESPTASASPTPTTTASPTPQVITRSSADKIAEFASSQGTFALLATSVASPLFDGDKYNTQRSLRTADALLTSALITDGLKRLVRAKRPDSDERNSFPSGHATAAFAAATMLSEYQPKQKLLWYGSASLIAWSRVKKRRHYWHDVVAGAAVGHLTARWELNSSRGLVLRPFIKTRRDNGDNQKTGFSLGGSF